MVILEQQFVNELGQIKVKKNPFHTRDSVRSYVRSYKVNRDTGVELLYACTNNLCNGRGWYQIQKPNGLWETVSCRCVDRVMEKIDGRK